jgi:hypothetical protein
MYYHLRSNLKLDDFTAFTFRLNVARLTANSTVRFGNDRHCLHKIVTFVEKHHVHAMQLLAIFYLFIFYTRKIQVTSQGRMKDVHIKDKFKLH